VLALHSDVTDSAVFGIPDAVMGESIAALIQLPEGASTGKEGKASILALLGQHLSMMKHPRHIEFVGELPRDDTGKLKKRRLRESYLARTMAPANVAAPAEANVALA